MQDELFNLKCCFARLEAARYDVFCMNMLIRELNGSPLTEGQIHGTCALQGNVQQMIHICRMLEISIQKSGLGRSMMAEFNERIPEIKVY